MSGPGAGLTARAAASSPWHAIGRQLAHPQGWGGRLLAPMMRLANRRPIRLAVEALEVGRHDFLLDLGCGPGDSVRMLAERASGGQVHGIDASALMVLQASRRNRARIRCGRVRIGQARFEALPFPDGAFDKVLAANVMYFWEDVPAVLGEVVRVLRPGGRLAVYVTDAASMRRWKFAGAGTHRLVDEAALGAALASAGLVGVRIDREQLPRGIIGLVAVAERAFLPQRQRVTGCATLS